MQRSAVRALVFLLLPLGLAVAGPAADDPVAGEWTLITSFAGEDMESTLRIERAEDGSLSGTYLSSRGQTIALRALRYEGGVLRFTRTVNGRSIGFEAQVEANRLEGRHKLGQREFRAWGARGAEALAALRVERRKANERDDDLEADYRKHSHRAAPRDGFPVLFDPQLTPAAEAEDIRDDEPVIGVALGGEAKAYPISIMGRHELANDTCGGRPITASW